MESEAFTGPAFLDYHWRIRKDHRWIPPLPPGTPPEITLNSTRTVTIIGIDALSFPLGAETLLILASVLSGNVGACVYSFYAIAEHLYVERDFDKAWAAWYLLRPPLGAGLGFILNLFIRGGLFSPGVALTGGNLIGFTAVSAIAGLFAEHVLRTFEKVADVVFPHRQGHDAKQTSKTQPTGDSTPSTSDSSVN